MYLLVRSFNYSRDLISSNLQYQVLGLLTTTIFSLTATASLAQDSLEVPEVKPEPNPSPEELETFKKFNPIPTFNPGEIPPEGYAPPPFQDTTSQQFTVYRLDVGDSISVSVPLFPEFNFAGTIDAEGNVLMPIVGRINFKGLTIAEVEAKVSYELGRSYLLEEPEVIAVLTAQRPVQINVLGQVTRPGFYNLPPGSNIINLFQLAGGTNAFADLRKIIVRRPLIDGTVIEEVVDLYTPLVTGNKPPALILQSGDTVLVSRLEVGQDLDYDRVLVSRTTLTQPNINIRVLFPSRNGNALRNITVPNGSTFIDVVASLPVEDGSLIKRDAITLMRFDPEKGKLNTQTLNADKVIEGDISQNVPLQDEDVIVVSRSLLGEISKS
ncbi:MAG: polysaccharide export protein [Cyanobacteria bacterium J083]|nr:MAG: polysaccharide export protein [Cyanobacteria bacterium J083]